nr:uncharacterized protein LOC105471597 isoform X2 [Macaca nemestrina]
MRQHSMKTLQAHGTGQDESPCQQNAVPRKAAHSSRKQAVHASSTRWPHYSRQQNNNSRYTTLELIHMIWPGLRITSEFNVLRPELSITSSAREMKESFSVVTQQLVPLCLITDQRKYVAEESREENETREESFPPRIFENKSLLEPRHTRLSPYCLQLLVHYNHSAEKLRQRTHVVCKAINIYCPAFYRKY